MPPPPPPARPAAPGSRPTPPRPGGPASPAGRAVSSNWSYTPGSAPSINDGGYRDLVVGTENYLIKKVTFEPIPNAQPPENRIVFMLDHDGEGDLYPVNLNVCSTDTMRAEISNKHLEGFVQACGITAKLNPGILNQLFAEKWVSVTAGSKPDKKDPKKIRVNIQRIDPVKWEDDSDTEAEQPTQEDPVEEPADEPETEAETETEAEAPAEETPAPTPPAGSKKLKPWDKPKPAAVNPDDAP